jgi:hypothetical protein
MAKIRQTPRIDISKSSAPDEGSDDSVGSETFFNTGGGAGAGSRLQESSSEEGIIVIQQAVERGEKRGGGRMLTKKKDLLPTKAVISRDVPMQNVGRLGGTNFYMRKTVCRILYQCRLVLIPM